MVGEHEDHKCEDALRRVQLLGDIIHQSWRGSGSSSQAEVGSSSRAIIALDTQVAPGGVNFSQGQRQLIAMARTLLRRCAIIILDEATSSIDFDTDSKIQATIREHFSESLLITSEFLYLHLLELMEWLNLAVAHRLATIVDYDRWIVLQDGKVSVRFHDINAH